MKKYILIAGVNGAGKSTLYQILQSLHEMPRVNSDEILREFGDWRNPNDVMTAGKIAAKKISRFFDEDVSLIKRPPYVAERLSKISRKQKRRATLLNYTMWELSM